MRNTLVTIARLSLIITLLAIPLVATVLISVGLIDKSNSTESQIGILIGAIIAFNLEILLIDKFNDKIKNAVERWIKVD